MVLVLISGTVLGAGIWFLTVDVPVDYDEPVLVTLYSETDDDGTTYGDGEFHLRDSHEHEHEADLTYESFHQYIEIDNPEDGKDDVTIEIDVTAYDDGDSETDEIAFVVLEGEVGPEDIEEWSWDSEYDWRVKYEETHYSVQRESLDEPIEIELTGGDDETRTVVYTNRNEEENESPYDVDGYVIEWYFEDVTDVE